MSPRNLLDLSERIWHYVTNTPSAPACYTADRTITYGQLGELAETQRRRLAVLPPNSPISVEAEKSPETLALLLACLRDQRTALLPSLQLPAATRQALRERSGCTTIVTPDTIIECAPASVRAEQVLPAIGDASFILTTSGSTGEPKMVPIGRSAVAQFCQWGRSYFSIAPGVTVLNYAPLNFDLCLLDIWTTLSGGAAVVLVSAEEAVRADRVAELINRYSVSIVQAVPMCFSLLEKTDVVMPSVRSVMFTGYALPPALLKRLPSLFPRARLFNIYGCTETNDSFVHEVTQPLHDHPEGIPIGDPIDGVEVRIVASESEIDLTSNPPTTRRRGELVVSTPFQTVGYLNQALNADRFIADPEASVSDPDALHPGTQGRVFYRTGDLVESDGTGQIWLVGRTDSQVKIRGVAISTSEVERVLMDHPDIDEAAVCVLPDPVEGKKLGCRVTITPASSLNSLTLRKYCADNLVRAAIPSLLEISEIPLPRLSNLKVDYGQLRRQFDGVSTPSIARRSRAVST